MEKFVNPKTTLLNRQHRLLKMAIPVGAMFFAYVASDVFNPFLRFL
jgi:hypothetical protein